MESKEVVIACMQRYGFVIEDDSDEKTLLTEYGMDSLTYMEIICELEDILNCEMTDYELLDVKEMTVERMIGLIEKVKSDHNAIV